MGNAMTRFLRRWFPAIFVLRQLIRLIFSRISYIHTSGLLHTFRVGRPETPAGCPLPWMNYSAIAFFQKRLTHNLALFEFGSGYSTFFFSRYVGEVTSVEYERTWYEKIHPDLPENASLIFCREDDDGKYCRSALTTGQLFDIILIDGRDRVNCVFNSPAALNDKGVILLDDSQRQEYREGILFLRSRGFKQIDFEGAKPLSVQMSRTSVFYRPGNCLDL